MTQQPAKVYAALDPSVEPEFGIIVFIESQEGLGVLQTSYIDQFAAVRREDAAEQALLVLVEDAASANAFAVSLGCSLVVPVGCTSQSSLVISQALLDAAMSGSSSRQDVHNAWLRKVVDVQPMWQQHRSVCPMHALASQLWSVQDLEMLKIEVKGGAGSSSKELEKPRSALQAYFDGCNSSSNCEACRGSTVEERKRLTRSASVNVLPGATGNLDVFFGDNHSEHDPPPLYSPESNNASFFANELFASSRGTSRTPSEASLDTKPLPRVMPVLQIVIHIIGSTGDVAPFIPIARQLHNMGHRVRIATHERFRKKVLGIAPGIEFYPIGGDPEVLMAFVVKNGGLIPSIESVAAGDVAKNREQLHQLINGAWESCIQPDQVTGAAFKPDCILANGPSYGSIHCAEALGVPFQIVFTMPWVPTGAFPHPFTGVPKGSGPRATINKLSYDVVHHLTWTGSSDFINALRQRIGLHKGSGTQLARVLASAQVPYTFVFSPSLLPKPKDWGAHIDIVGFSFDDDDASAQSYQPPAELADFLAAGPPPVYCGFGSIVGFDMASLYQKVIEACQRIGARLIVCEGWNQLDLPSPEGVLIIKECPHSWLFPRCVAVCHHGGAGTTSAGLRHALPSILLSFFGDQPFWGKVVAAAGAGPVSMPANQATVQKLVDSFTMALLPTTRARVEQLAKRINAENGASDAVKAILRKLPIEAMVSDLGIPIVAYRVHVPTGLRISQVEAEILVKSGRISEADIKRYVPSHIDLSDEVEGHGSLIALPIKGLYEGLSKSVIMPYKGYKEGKLALGIAKGVGSLVYYPLKGFVLLPAHVGTGFYKLQRLYDPTFQAVGKVTGLKSAGKETVKSIARNFTGAMTDMYTMPRDMGREEGGKGVAKGLAIGIANLPVRTVAGAMDLLVIPTKGIVREVTKHFKKERLLPEVALSSDGLDPGSVVALWDQALGELVAMPKESKKYKQHDEKDKKGKRRDDAEEPHEDNQHEGSSKSSKQ